MAQRPDQITRPHWTLVRILACLSAGIVGGVCFACVALAAGVIYGGNYASDFQFNGAHGYEATGQLGAIIGFVAGAPLFALLVAFMTRRRT